MSFNFEVGMKVVLVDDRHWDLAYRSFLKTRDLRLPEKGAIYTIREIRREHDGMLCLLMAEIVNPPIKYPFGLLEPSFDAARFRPLQRRPTDIYQFEKLLDTTSVRELV
jgi:hypothetical protein